MASCIGAQEEKSQVFVIDMSIQRLNSKKIPVSLWVTRSEFRRTLYSSFHFDRLVVSTTGPCTAALPGLPFERGESLRGVQANAVFYTALSARPIFLCQVQCAMGKTIF
jgi:hypothetical protein